MKVLFAVGSDQLSKNIADKYYERYGEVLEYKNVFFFKALIDEVKKNKSYDRVIINEEFEEFKATDLEQIDRAVFNYIDKVTDEIQDAEIILICANRRNPGDSFVNKLFSIGIYNMLIGNDRNMNPLCEIIKRPRTKREAKEYLHIDTSIISSESITRDNEVEEHQIKSILTFFDGIRNQPEKFLETFDRVAEQYSMTQLKIIVEYLPKVVKDEIFKADRYKYLMPQTDAPKTGNASNATNTQATTKNPKKPGGFLGGLFNNPNKGKPIPKGGSIDMSQMQPGGVDLSSNAEEQKKAALEAEARRRAAEEKAKEEKAKEEQLKQEQFRQEQERLAQKAKEDQFRQEQERLAKIAREEQEKLEAKARAEIEAARAKRDEERKIQLELEAQKRADAAREEQERLLQRAKEESAERERKINEAKAIAEENAKRQAELAAQQRAEAMKQQQNELAARAKMETNARVNAGFTSNMTGGAEIPKGPGNLIEVKPNPNAPDRQIQKPGIPTATVNPNQTPKIDISQNVSRNINTQVSVGQNISVNPEPIKKPEPVVETKIEQPKVEQNIKVNEVKVNPIVPPTPKVEPIVNVNQEPKINITTNSGVAPTGVNTSNPVQSAGTQQNNFVPPVNNVISEQEKKMREEQEKLAMQQRKIREEQERLEEEKRKLREEQEKFVSAQTQLRNEMNTPTPAPQYTNTSVPMQTTPVSNFKKMVVFVGANKVGTTFVTNAVAHSVASAKITTSIIDMTRDKSLYYIYADESKALKNRAAECMQRLSEGEDYYIETMNSYLKLYTTVAGSVSDQRRGYKHKAIIETVKKNCNLTIVDADFTTPIDYFDQADEIYLVQDLDILKIQDVTLFLREINARGLDKKKIKLIINKFVKTSITPKIIIGALDFYHDPAGTYVDSGLMPAKVDYSIIPYNLNNYAKYVESLHKMSGNFNYKNYSTDFNQAIDEIVAKVYPKNLGGKKKFFG